MALGRERNSNRGDTYSDDDEEVKTEVKVTKSSVTNRTSTNFARTTKSLKTPKPFKKKSDISRLQSKVIARLSIFGLILVLGLSTRLYRLDEPSHIW